MALPISIQLYTVRDLIAKQGYLPVLKQVAEIGYGHIEIGDFYAKTAKEFKASIDPLGLKVSGVWGPILDPQKREKFVEDVSVFGIKDVITGYGPDTFDSDDKIKKTAETLNQALDYFVPKGFTVSLHNHWWEFHSPRYDKLLELCPRAHLELDIYWTHVGGGNAPQYIQKYGKRIRFLHIKDGPSKQKNPELNMVAVGSGDVPVADSIHAAEKAGNVAALPIELDRCGTDMMGAVRDSYTYLIKNGLAAGKK